MELGQWGVAGAFGRQFGGHKEKVTDREPCREGDSGQVGPGGCGEAATPHACDGEMSDEPLLAVGGAGHDGHSGVADRLGEFVEARDGNLEDPGAAEPSSGRPDGAVDRTPNPGPGVCERVNQQRQKGPVHIA